MVLIKRDKTPRVRCILVIHNQHNQAVARKVNVVRRKFSLFGEQNIFMMIYRELIVDVE